MRLSAPPTGCSSPGSGFVGARKIVGYLDDLGIETLYLSPVLRGASRVAPTATTSSNPTRLDPALGTPEEFEALLTELDAHGMRALLDIVPNHMATHPANPWWWDTLRHGPGSPFAQTFDIDWSRHEGRVMVPTLSAPLGDLVSVATWASGSVGPMARLDGQAFPLPDAPAY